MHDAGAVRVVQCARDLACDAHGILDGKRTLVTQPMPERFVRRVWHDVVEPAIRVAGVEERNDVRVCEPRSDLDFSKKSFLPNCTGELGTEQLDRDLPMVFTVLGEKDHGRPAATEFPLDRVLARERSTDVSNPFDHERRASNDRPGEWLASQTIRPGGRLGQSGWPWMPDRTAAGPFRRRERS
jgi:hypothetical protein